MNLILRSLWATDEALDGTVKNFKFSACDATNAPATDAPGTSEKLLNFLGAQIMGIPSELGFREGLFVFSFHNTQTGTAHQPLLNNSIYFLEDGIRSVEV